MKNIRVLKGIWLGVLVLFMSVICMVNNIYAEDVSIAFLHQGVNYATSLIRDAKVHYVRKTNDGRMFEEVDWAYQTGKEFLRFKTYGKDSELAGDNACYYDGERTVVFLYPVANKNQKPSASIRSGELLFILKTIHKCPPAALFLRFWPVGITLDKILSDGRTVLLPQKEVIDNSQCYVIDLQNIGGDYDKDLGYKIWLDPARGFLPRKIEIWKDGQVRMTIGPIILERFGENIWFPIRAEVKFYSSLGETKGPVSVEIDQIKINEGLDDSVFTPVFEPGMTVYDEQLGSSYVVPQP